METQARYLVVGSFVVLLLLGALLFVIWIGKSEFSSRDKIYDIYFQGSVTGLKEGGQVLYRGVPVGTVQFVKINPKNIEEILVRVSLDPDTPVRGDTQATLEMQGITGIAFVQLKGGSPQSPALETKPGESYPIIPSQPSRLEEIVEAAPKLLKNLNSLTEHLDLLFNVEARDNIHSILANLQEITQAFAQKSESIEQLIDKANEAFEGMTELSQKYSVVAQTLEKEIVPLSQSAQNFFQESKEFLAENRQPLNIFLTSGLYEVSNVTSELRRTLESINRIAVGIERNPWVFLFGSEDKGYVLQD